MEVPWSNGVRGHGAPAPFRPLWPCGPEKRRFPAFLQSGCLAHARPCHCRRSYRAEQPCPSLSYLQMVDRQDEFRRKPRSPARALRTECMFASPGSFRHISGYVSWIYPWNQSCDGPGHPSLPHDSMAPRDESGGGVWHPHRLCEQTIT